MKKNHGGARSKAGRKRVADKAIQVSIYPRDSQIKAVGGFFKAKEIALAAIVTEANNNLAKALKKS